MGISLHINFINDDFKYVGIYFKLNCQRANIRINIIFHSINFKRLFLLQKH